MTIPITENIIQQLMINKYSGNDFIVYNYKMYKVVNKTQSHIEITDYETNDNR